MKTVYAASSGSYSDYKVTLLFTSKELAEAFCERENATKINDGVYVEEFQLWDELPDPAEILWRISVWVRDHQVGGRSEWPVYAPSWEADPWEPSEQRTDSADGTRYLTVIARTKEEAERRVGEWVAEQIAV